MAKTRDRSVKPAEGKLGVLLVGLGAVATTYVAGVENVRRGRGKPIGSLCEMGTIRLGKRTENRVPKVRDFVPLALPGSAGADGAQRDRPLTAADTA